MSDIAAMTLNATIMARFAFERVITYLVIVAIATAGATRRIFTVPIVSAISPLCRHLYTADPAPVASVGDQRQSLTSGMSSPC